MPWAGFIASGEAYTFPVPALAFPDSFTHSLNHFQVCVQHASAHFASTEFDALGVFRVSADAVSVKEAHVGADHEAVSSVTPPPL